MPAVLWEFVPDRRILVWCWTNNLFLGGGGGYFKQLAGRNRNLEDVVIILRTRACCTYSVIVNWWERVYGLLTQSK